MTLGLRGYNIVHLIEAEAEIGGHLRWVSKLPNFGDWKRVIDWRETQIKSKTNVQIALNSRLNYQDILECGAERVIFATGSHWDETGMSSPLHDYIAGADASKPEICTPEQHCVDGKKLGKRVLVVDNDPYYMGSAMAELIAGNGHEVTYATYGETVGPYLRFTLEEQRMLMRLLELGVTTINHHIAVAVENGNATLVNIFKGEETTVAFDSVMLVTHRTSNCELYDQLQGSPDDMSNAGIKSIHLIGDAHTPNVIAQATFSATRLAREFDSDNPDQHKPFIRERRLIGATEEDYQLDAETLLIQKH